MEKQGNKKFGIGMVLGVAAGMVPYRRVFGG